MHAGAVPTMSTRSPQVACTRIEQRLPPRRVASPTPPEVALEVPLGDEVGEHLLLERGRVVVREELQGRKRRHQRGGQHHVGERIEGHSTFENVPD